MPRTATPAFKMRIRIYASGCTFGRGKAELLSRIEATGSLAAAAKEMEMSYMRAWKLVQEMNQVPKGPMVELSRGGAHRGAGALTTFGRKVLGLYQKIDRESAATARPDALRLVRLLE